MDIFLDFGERVKLPILPSSFEKQGGVNNTEANINSLGSINLLGKRGLKRMEFQSFFPAQNYSFCKCKPKKPKEYVRYLEKAMEKKKIGVCTVTRIGISFRCTIESFNYGVEDGTGDVMYTISLVEYRGGLERHSERKKPREYRAKAGDNFNKIARKVFGSSKNAEKIAKANKKKGSYKFKASKEIKIPEGLR